MQQLVADLLEAHRLVLDPNPVHGLSDKGIGDEADQNVATDPLRSPVVDWTHSQIMFAYAE